MRRSTATFVLLMVTLVCLYGCGRGGADADAHADHHDDHDHEHDHTGPNPHVWLDPVLMRRFVLELDRHMVLDSAAGDDRPMIVTTIWPVANLVQQMVGDRAVVKAMVPAGASPHDYEPTQRDMQALTRCQVLIAVGMNFDAPLFNALDRVNTSGAKVLRIADLIHVDEDASSEQAPPGEPRYPGTKQLLADLDAIDAEYHAALDGHKGAMIVTYHNAFDRLAARYGLVVAATLTPIDSIGAPPHRRITEARDVIREHHLKALFTEPQFSPSAAQAIEEETGVAVLTLDPLGHPDMADRNTYQKLMRYNLRILLAGITGDTPLAPTEK
ncbi:MAG: hypothetical protein GC159_16895 [Phycisphaera sp.]|nr:hypothetical protein [Phycisphaera sp.]